MIAFKDQKKCLAFQCAFRRSRPVVPAHRDQCDAGAWRRRWMLFL